MRKKNLATMLFLSTEEEISTEEDIEHVVEAVAPVAVVAVIFRISTKELHALNATRMATW